MQGASTQDSGNRLAVIIKRVQAALTDERRLVVLTIPDVSVTPQAKEQAESRDIAAKVDAFNAVIRAEAEHAAVEVVDLFPLSQRLAGTAYTAADGIHPSAAAHARWEQFIYPVVRRVLMR